MAAAILRARGLTSHLLPLAAGFKQSKFRPQGREGAREKLEGFCQVLEEALSLAHKDLDRLILARELMSRVTRECRSNSKLPELVELFLSRPLVTGPLAAKLLKVTPKAVDLMLAQLGGVLLGSGGLVRAYGGTAAACLRAAKRVEIVPVQEATIFVPFSDLALVKARLSGASGVQIRNENFTEAGVTITADLPEAAAPHIVRMITDITSGRVSISIKP
jgi:hypothetical protein